MKETDRSEGTSPEATGSPVLQGGEASPGEYNMPLRKILGLVGSLILFIGVFTPIISLPVVGNLNYFQNGKGDGLVILVFSVFSVFLTLTKRYKFLLFTGIGSLTTLAFTFIKFHESISQIESQIGALGEVILNTVQIQWGFAVLIVGAAFLIAAALLKETALETEEEKVDETLSFGGVSGAKSRIKDSVVYYVLVVIGVVCLGLIIYSFLASEKSFLNPENPEEIAYINNVTVSRVEVGKTILGAPGIFGEVKNNGNKTLGKVEITIYFLDKQGNPISEKTYSPVNNSTSPLKPNYSQKFGYEADDAPSDWSKKITVKVTKVQFAK